jgi:hypothetical protein
MILAEDKQIKAKWKDKMPFFCYQGKMLCYLWTRRSQPYLEIVEGRKIKAPELIGENRSPLKILLTDPEVDLPTGTIRWILRQALAIYQH